MKEKATKKKNRPAEEAPVPQSEPPQESRSTCTIVAVGASAGGLEAFQEVLINLPADTGAAFVFIQHLDPRHTSILSELLSRSTVMPVMQVTDQMSIQSNHVYVIPPNVGMRLAGDRLTLTERSGAGPHMPIDEFFRSLAEHEGGHAIAVLLSGNASDGTLGLKAVKAVGGIAIAQDQSAKFDAMPRNAVSAGWVDMVLPPDRIANEIVRLCRHPYVNGHGAMPLNAEPAEPEGERFQEIFGLLRSSTGVDFTLYKHGTLRRRILRRMVLNRIESADQYARRLKEDRAELKALFHDILISVTGFFRENSTFEALHAHVFPEILRDRSPENPVRVWVPGCSTGEDAYSVAISLLEFMLAANLQIPIQIFGTDLSEPALERARLGLYPESIAADVSPERLRRFFVKADGQYQISRPVRDACIFAQQNLTKDPPFSKLDLIVCRNLLIYLGPALQNKVMRFFHYALKPTGFLVLGLSETVGNSAEFFSPLDKRLKIYTRKNVSPPIHPLDFGSYEETRVERPPHKPHMSSSQDVQRRVDQFILSRFSPAGVLIDDDLNILQFHGHTSPYLEHASGEPVLSLNRMLRGELAVEVRKVFDKVRRKQTAAQGEPIAIRYLEQVHNVRISITPMTLPGTAANRYLVLFEEFPPAEPKKSASRQKPDGKSGKTTERMRELEEELHATKQYLESVIEEQQATTEELKSANEEVQSSNEELQSTNEELLTAKEELQSTNEELTTVNEEMHSRNAELTQINNDLNNLLSSVNIPIVMVGNDLRIRRFTPQAERVLNLLPSDVGRPINDFKPKIDIPNLDQIFLDVIESLRVREREVQDRDGQWYSMWVRPYRTADHKIDGAVMVLFDVTERKQAAEARYRRVFEAARDGIMIVDGETGEIIDMNPYLAKTFGISRAASVGLKYWDLDVFRGTELNSASFTELQETEFMKRTIVVTSKTGGRYDIETIGNLYLEGERRVIQLNLRDVTERRRGERSRTQQDLQYQRMEALAMLARSAARDFNNLLTAITGYTELLRVQTSASEPAAEDLQQMGRAVDRANRLLRQLLAFAPRSAVQAELLDLNELVDDMQQLMRFTVPPGVDLSIDLTPDIAPVRVDRGQMQYVLLNLLVNARESMRSGGQLRIGTANFVVDRAHATEHPAVPPGNYVVLEISDTGGTGTEPQPRLWETLFTPKARAEGSGLGAVYNTVRQSGGHLWAASELGRGSTLRIFLPQVKDTPRAPEGGLQGRETILLAEDDELVRSVAARILRQHGYTVLESAGGEQTIEAARSSAGPIDLLLAELEMQAMTGPELAEQISADRPHMKVLYLSGNGEDGSGGAVGPPAAVSFITKPFSPEALARSVRAILER